MSERRFSDSEIRGILRRAVELEVGSSSVKVSEAGGLTLRELQEVAEEAGISPSMVSRAAAEADGRVESDPMTFIGRRGAKKEVRTLPGELAEDEVAELMRVVDQEVDAQGTVVEALGGVRWTSNTRFQSTQVSVEPSGKETLLRVEEQYSDVVRGPLHGVPTAWGLILGLAMGLEQLNLALPLLLVLVAVTALVGWASGEMIWRSLTSGSEKRTRALADRLTTEASRLLPPPADEG